MQNADVDTLRKALAELVALKDLKDEESRLAEQPSLRILLKIARDALEYHQYQTRPIHTTKVVIETIDEALKEKT